MKTRALFVHLFTAAGLIPMMLAVDAIWRDQIYIALIWLGVAMLIDSLDGPLARRFNVAEHMPQIDGAILDHVIDFTGYCFLPALIIYHFSMVPEDFVVIATSYLLVTSLYTFANRAAKTPENDFRGFPALWNVVVFYMVVFETGAWFNLTAIFLLGVMTFAPLRFVHPLRVVSLRYLNAPLAFIWAAIVFIYLGVGVAGARAVLPPLVDILFLTLSLYFLVLSGWRSWSLRSYEDA